MESHWEGKRLWAASRGQLQHGIQPMMENLDLESSRGFDWDKRKSRSNLDKHGIDFDDAVEIFYGPVILRRSDRNNEERWIAIGFLENRP